MEHTHHHHDNHHHDDHCSCHDHDHHDGHCSCHDQEPGDGITISRHEGAIIGSMTGIIPIAELPAAQEALASRLRALHALVEQAGGITGHIKFILTGPSQCCQISVTDVSETVRHFSTDVCRLEGVAIVFGVEENTLRQAMTATLGTIVTTEP